MQHAARYRKLCANNGHLNTEASFLKADSDISLPMDGDGDGDGAAAELQ